MDRRIMNTLLVNDDDLECNCDKLTLDEINISTLGFAGVDLERFDLIFYIGKRGTKLIKSKHTKTGKIV